MSINGGAVSTTDGIVSAGTISQDFCFAVPVGATFDGGETHARFRLSTAGGLSYDGAASDGEVEDYWMPLAKVGNLVWEDTDVKNSLIRAMQGSGAIVPDEGRKDAAIVLTLEPGGYSVDLSSVDGQVGVGLVEVFEVR